MAWTPPGPGKLRHRVRFDRKVKTGENVGGIVRPAGWTVLVDHRRCLLEPVRGGEQVTADRAAGISMWTLTCYKDPGTRQVTIDDRVVDLDDPTLVFDVRSSLDLQGRGRWLVMTLEAGVGDGRQGT